MAEEKRIAPDGGWGWVIVFSFALSNFFAIPIIQNFGLLFRNIFEDLNFSASDVSTIININSAAGLFCVCIFMIADVVDRQTKMLVDANALQYCGCGFGMISKQGFVNGPLIKKFGYRKYAIAGSISIFVGFLLTSFATTMTEFIFYYGIIESIGLNMLIASFSLALNSYFAKRRSIASGFSSTITGLGPVIMPLFISKSIEQFTARGTALILSGLLLHCFLASMLLHPVKWHYKIVKEETELEPLTEADASPKANGRPLTLELGKRDDDIDLDQEALDMEPTTPGHILEGVAYPRRVSQVEGLGKVVRRELSQSRISLYDRNVVVEADSKWWNSKGSISDDRRVKRRRTLTCSSSENGPLPEKLANAIEGVEENRKPSLWSRIVKTFDLDLLKDPIYVNIWLGMSIAFTGEINFSLMTPIILGDRDFDIDETARIMSTIATADIIFRFVSPFIGDYLKLPARKMYMISLLFLAATRFSLTCVSSYNSTLMVAVGLGVAKGFRSVYMTLVIPNQVPLEKLASASGLQTVLNGLFLFAFGPVVGVLREAFGTFDVVIHLTNVMSVLTVAMWAVEMMIVRFGCCSPSETTQSKSQI